MENVFDLIQSGLQLYFNNWFLCLGTTVGYIMFTASRIYKSILSSM